MSQRSQVAKSGSMPMEACSAACRAPPRISGLIRAASSWSSVTVHHTARVRSVRGGRSSLVSPSTSPVMSRRRRKETTWLVTSTEPKQSRAVAPRDLGVGLQDGDGGGVAGDGRVRRVGLLDQGDGVLQVQVLHQVRAALVEVDGARRGRWCGRRAASTVPSSRPGAGLDDLDRACRPRRGCR